MVTQGAIENLATGFTRTWQRPPTEEELQGLVRDYIREEAAYREALAMGLDRDDMIVRRRLRQKLEFLSDDLASRTEPTDDQLQVFLRAHPELFHREPLFSFIQVYLNPQIHGANLRRQESRLLNLLQKGRPDLGAQGDPFLLPQSFQDITLADVKKTFGEQFTSALSTLPVGQWRGPIPSSYGEHLILLSKRTDHYVPALAEVRDQVRREWFDAKRVEATNQFYEALLRRYTVRINARRKESRAGTLMRRTLLFFTFVAMFANNLPAHEVRPAYLQLRQTAADSYDIFWKVPALGDNMRLSLYVQLPAACSNVSQPRGFYSAGAYTEQWSVKCPGGLAGSTIRIEGLTATLTDALVRVERLDGPSRSRVSPLRLPPSPWKPRLAASRSHGPISSWASNIFLPGSTIYFSCRVCCFW